MDEHRFDQLSRRFAGFRTRRQAVKAIAGAVVATVAGSSAVDAQQCTGHYGPCSGDGQCCSGAVCEHGLCMPGCRIDGAFTSAWVPNSANICQVCTPELSTTSWSPANEGMSCWSGDPNAGVTVCQAGTCAAVAPQSCPPPTACHLEGEVDPVTGMCVNPPAEAGTLCGNPAMCYGEFYTPADTCDGAGFCIGGGSQTRPCAPYRCGGNGACTTSCHSDTDCASGAHCDDGQCFPDADLGHPCDEDGDCQSGLCVEGVCCNQRCEGLCETCSAATGGVCSPVICEDDGLLCTSGVCDEETGQCTHVLHPNTCLVDGRCASDGSSPIGNVCLVCDAAADPNAWTTVVCDDGLSCTTTTCDPATGCGQTINAGTCLIDGVCYASGAVNPANACQLCSPALSQTAWSNGVNYNGTCVTSIAGELTVDDPHAAVICGESTSLPYDLYTFVHAGGPIQIGMRGQFGSGGTLYDSVLQLNAGTFNPANPCAGLVELDDDAGCGRDAYIDLLDLPAGTYTLVATTYPRFDTSERYGTYTVTFGQGPAC